MDYELTVTGDTVLDVLYKFSGSDMYMARELGIRAGVTDEELVEYGIITAEVAQEYGWEGKK